MAVDGDPSAGSGCDEPVPHVSMARVAALFRPYARQLAVVLSLIALASAIGVAVPLLLRASIDDALPRGDLNLLALLVSGMVVLGSLESVIGVLVAQMMARVGQSIMHGLRVRVYAHLQLLSLRFFTGVRTGEIQSRIASDIGGLQAVVTTTASDLARNMSVVLMTTVAMLVLEWRLAMLAVVVLPIGVWLSDRVGRMRETATHEQQRGIADMSSTVQESLSISGVIQARTMHRGSNLIRRFGHSSKDVARLEVRAQTAGQWQWSVIGVILRAVPAMTLLLGGWLMVRGSNPTSIGTLVAMIALQGQLLFPLLELLQTGVQIRTTRALFARIFEYLDQPVEIVEKPNPVHPPRSQHRGAVRLSNVGFRYETSTESAVSDVTIDIAPGTHVAIVGPTGAGKTTLGYLLARLYDVDTGAITYDGIDVRDLSFASLADILGVVTQEPYLMNATVAENMRFAAPDASDDDLIAAAQVAQVHDLISGLPRGYETQVGERGYRFSGGEKQRLALARVVLRNPPVLLLDEAASALDNVTERAVTQALGVLAKNRTTITIAHRLSSVENADKIVVMNHGRAIEQGTHVELLARNGLYAELAHRARSRQSPRFESA